jgi:hypothetical protein
MPNKCKAAQTVHEEITEQILIEIKWLARNQTKPTNYLLVVIVSIVSSALTALTIML